MPTRKDYFYWDACVFSSYVGAIPERMPVIDAILEQIAKKDSQRQIITSNISIVEVAFASGHGHGRRMPPEIESRIDELWRSPLIEIAEVNSFLMFRARGLMRDAVDHGWSLKPNDAIHLATAQWVNDNIAPVPEFHTYDINLLAKMSVLIGGLLICEPRVDQLRLPFNDSST